MFERGQQFTKLASRLDAFNADHTLARRRQHLPWFEFFADTRLQAKTLQARNCEDDCLEVTVIQFSEASRNITAQRVDRHVGAQGEQLCLPAQAGATDDSPGR